MSEQKTHTTATDSTPAPAAATPAAARHRRFTPAVLWQSIGPLTVFVLLFALVAILQPSFLTGGQGLVIVATTATATLLVALAQSMVLHVGSIDLSNAAMALFSAILLAKMIGSSGPIAAVIAIVVVTCVGALNGWLVAYFQVPSFALTLGMLGILQAASLIVSDSTTAYATNADSITNLYNDAVGGLPMMFWIAVVLAVLLWALLRFTVLGQSMTAVGLNESGALFSGLRTRRLKIVAFAFSGLLAGVAGVTIIAQAGSASSTGLGSDLLLPAIASALVGGTAITGGVSNPINVVFGALTVSLIPIGAAAIGIPTEAQSLVYGLVIIVVVALTTTRRHGVVK